MKLLRTVIHCARYVLWLTGQIIVESVAMVYDTFTTGRNIAPVVLYYPLRVTSERDIAALIASITMTPGTLALGVTGPKEVDYDAAAGHRDRHDASAVAGAEFDTHGLTNVQRFLAVHAMYGSEPEELLHDIAVMEAKLAPSVRKRKQQFDVKHLVERGTPGPRGYHGSRGGRARNEDAFDMEKVDSTPHAAAFVAAILAQEASRDPAHAHELADEIRQEIAERNARRARGDDVSPFPSTWPSPGDAARLGEQDGTQDVRADLADRRPPGDTVPDTPPPGHSDAVGTDIRRSIDRARRDGIPLSSVDETRAPRGGSRRTPSGPRRDRRTDRAPDPDTDHRTDHRTTPRGERTDDR
ncbi:Na+/H+ antiporter subunit E [Corynebacterium bovis]|uniref:Na+/H+ antiporter subunit E n=1 Tax=Corynebacterium bovis TaxID=36808 RepID=UPI00244C3D73|nr:Na+/H+ antiporter subunit E [Corynebacterium bovis]MDH2455827.1 Na+/H+ antiporter subunit E [Corynebacterium bovis]